MIFAADPLLPFPEGGKSMKRGGLLASLASASFAALAIVNPTFGSSAYAGTVSTIWGAEASGGGPILKEWSLNGTLLDTITAPHGVNGRGVVQVGNILYYDDASDNNIYAYNWVTNTDPRHGVLGRGSRRPLGDGLRWTSHLDRQLFRHQPGVRV
jgi:hypothetical protein